MLTREYDYALPDEAIAQTPAPRGESRLLVLDAEGQDRHRCVQDLPDLLDPGDLVVVNDTRVIPARLFGRRRPGGGRVELLLIEPHDELEWDALAKPGRKARPGTVLELGVEEAKPRLTAEVIAKGGDGRHRLRFSEPIEPHLDRLGHVPLPPYIRRPDRPEDRERYQTVWARRPGAIAAPTAGLHFTPEILESLEAKGIRRTHITLHVGIGTFKPMTTRLVHEHRMDAERFEISPGCAKAIEQTRREGGRVVAVGTTVVRTLESAARDEPGTVAPGPGTTGLFIYPGFQFRLTDVLLTNFHLPRSTLLLLVSAFAGRDRGRERILAAYREALEHGYRFYSYGDAMLLERG